MRPAGSEQKGKKGVCYDDSQERLKRLRDRGVEEERRRGRKVSGGVPSTGGGQGKTQGREKSALAEGRKEEKRGVWKILHESWKEHQTKRKRDGYRNLCLRRFVGKLGNSKEEQRKGGGVMRRTWNRTIRELRSRKVPEGKGRTMKGDILPEGSAKTPPEKERSAENQKDPSCLALFADGKGT